MKKNSGFTLIELIIFIVIMGIIASMVAISYHTMFKGSGGINRQTLYSQAAVQCMEWYLGQRALNGYAGSELNTGTKTPGAGTPSFCTAPTGYGININITGLTLYAGDPSYKKIDISVTTLGSTQTITSLSTIVADY
jgi:prepilin-type N-terminal cleavage/methylation domain-containing protein